MPHRQFAEMVAIAIAANPDLAEETCTSASEILHDFDSRGSAIRPAVPK